MEIRKLTFEQAYKGIKRRIHFILQIFIESIKYLVAILCSIIFIKKNRSYWIISERGTDARDNGYHLFKFIRKNYPDIDIRYIISAKSADTDKVKNLGRVIKYRSFQHYLSMYNSSIKISTHIMGYSPNIDVFSLFDKLGIIKGKKVFLQHGVIKDNLFGLYNSNVKLDLFICSAKREYETVLENYGHPKGVVKCLGLPRFDNLNIIQPKKSILVMPTWRVWLKSLSSSEEFIESEYYKTYINLLANEELKRLLEKEDYNLVFYPHYEMQKYIDKFYSNNSRIGIASFNDYDVQELLNESAILITDYSSVFFDFAYMERPVVYYQFDSPKFIKNHYAQSYFDYSTDGFGPVVDNEKLLIQELSRLIVTNEGKIENKYLFRINKFFNLRDRGNCMRVFNAIKSLENTGVSDEQ
ncbi:CDP-glycerol glycerophosphotransferase family protein [Bacillus benzoevorans]|uniref:CDP-glycerol glycerophosphotransferase (TagB/SpsB family) n=1 Tax=Bacillus benzoevorans TaxID=1456 RepID=A0A7X0HVC4_9BACI|nr:CDP-glycerol glycerophosphotransferase family protein [Bacillus benzoevorans]MBB6447574.1 CDP-glycerol glycerophosphotransferase (TagB/SpsB family) [Bacillus benzoevorans]